jgi:hypothetical protein
LSSTLASVGWSSDDWGANESEGMGAAPTGVLNDLRKGTKMPPNEVVSLNRLYVDWCRTRLINGKAPGGIQPFEYFCAEQFLKSYSLNDDELRRGMIGDGDDGGIDSCHCFIERVLIDDNTKVDRRGDYVVDLVLMQMRENKGFSPTALEKMDRFTDDLLDLERGPDDYRYDYHSRLQDLMRIFKQKMLGMTNYKLRITYYFVTRRDEPPNRNCIRAAKNIAATIRRHLPDNAEMQPFNFAGAASLYRQSKLRPPSEKKLEFEKSFDTREGWIGLVSLRKFYEFLKDDELPNQLNETIFDDNVRGYFLNTPINRAITTTLTHPNEQPEFWLLNNGITILTPSAQLKSGRLEIKDPQIVNGLQTSRRIFDYYKQGGGLSDTDPRRIIVRVITNEDPEIRDEIIRATNNQNKMPPEALISTSILHKQLDGYFAERDLYYDRRKGHYKDQGKEIGKIISILTVIQAVVAIILRKPNDARGRPRDYVTKDTKRWSVFGPDDYRQPAQESLIKQDAPYDLEVYVQCVRILRRVDEFLENPGLRLDNTQTRNIRFYLVRYAASALTNNAHCPPGEIKTANVALLTDDTLKQYLGVVEPIYRKHGNNDDAAKGKHFIAELDSMLLAQFPAPSVIASRRRARKAKA